jgi:hypothetical protein
MLALLHRRGGSGLVKGGFSSKAILAQAEARYEIISRTGKKPDPSYRFIWNVSPLILKGMSLTAQFRTRKADGHERDCMSRSACGS